LDLKALEIIYVSSVYSASAVLDQLITASYSTTKSKMEANTLYPVQHLHIVTLRLHAGYMQAALCRLTIRTAMARKQFITTMAIAGIRVRLFPERMPKTEAMDKYKSIQTIPNESTMAAIFLFLPRTDIFRLRELLI
jgi:hypothetical protein